MPTTQTPNKQYKEQIRIVSEVLHSRNYNPELKAGKGVMIESYLLREAVRISVIIWLLAVPSQIPLPRMGRYRTAYLWYCWEMLIFMDNTNNSCCCGETEHFSGCPDLWSTGHIQRRKVLWKPAASAQSSSWQILLIRENGHFVSWCLYSYGTYIPVIIALRSSSREGSPAASGRDHGPSFVPCMDLNIMPLFPLFFWLHFAIMESVWITIPHYLKSGKERSRFPVVPLVAGECSAAAGAGISMSVMTGSGPSIRMHGPFHS